MSDQAALFVGETKRKEVDGVVKSDSNSWSTIGRPSSGSDDEDGSADEVQSKAREGPLDSLAALENTLPMKRGLSSYYNGRCKSFLDLSEESVGTGSTTALGKEEHIVNKKRRLYLFNKSTTLVGGCTSTSNAIAPGEKVGENDDDDDPPHDQDQGKSDT